MPQQRFSCSAIGVNADGVEVDRVADHSLACCSDSKLCGADHTLLLVCANGQID